MRGGLNKGLSMGMFGKRVGGGRRSAARASAPLTAVLTTLVGSRSAVLADVSSTGARVRGTDLPAMGEELVINIERVQAFGSVAWSDSGECGIVFEPPLDADDEDYLRQLVAAARGLPPDIQAALENWTVGAGR